MIPEIFRPALSDNTWWYGVLKRMNTGDSFLIVVEENIDEIRASISSRIAYFKSRHKSQWKIMTVLVNDGVVVFRAQ
jgi:hypothetical protein